MICIDKKYWGKIKNNPNLKHSVVAICTKDTLGPSSPYLVLQESFLLNTSTVSEHLDEDLDIPLVDIHFCPTRQ